MLLAWLAGCATAPPPPAAQITAGPTDPKRLVAVLVAGDGSLPAFDNATSYVADTLAAAGVPPTQIHRLSGSLRRAPELATGDNLLKRLQETEVPPGGSCLVYLTSHGAYEHGLYLSASNDTLMPSQLDRALELGCGQAPTVVIVSACFAGQFTQPPMPRANRIILTAADAGRTSFGCGASFRYTYFDECLLGALGEAASWQEVFGRAVTCVAQRERQIGALPSEPTASFGAAMTGVAPPAGPGPVADPHTIQFIPGTGLFDPALVPLPFQERLRLHDDLSRYAAAVPPKALAMTAQGLLVPVARGRDGQRTESDVARLALQRCEWLTGGACILYARDAETVRLLPSGLAPFHPPRLARTGRLTVDLAPFIRDDQRPQIERYLAAETPKALALSPGHEEIGVGHGATIEDARRDALAQCRSGRLDCVIYAEDDRIVLGWTN
ncbi:MAG TPA: C13 family peptidase [Aliidongia sp.]|uniref:C13 family peptidase n=1 Tax=Aliidongia sp. TaxID=1914230 RepID=UPI002DDD470C|nr:C13 family peptidase [Aliidongia sp.]HEV2675771.1 C13 family peptidase [Aliidongia sp.]